MYEKAHLILDFKKKKISSGGARTHENETRPEEICVPQSQSARKMFSHLDTTLVVPTFGMAMPLREI